MVQQLVLKLAVVGGGGVEGGVTMVSGCVPQHELEPETNITLALYDRVPGVQVNRGVAEGESGQGR